VCCLFVYGNEIVIIFFLSNALLLVCNGVSISVGSFLTAWSYGLSSLRNPLRGFASIYTS